MRKIKGSMVAVTAMAAAVFAGAACTGGGSGGGGAEFGDTECAECIGNACSAEILSCSAQADCAEALECILECPEEDNALDTTCAQNECAALVTTSAGGTALDGVFNCYLAESTSSGTCSSQCSPPTE